MYKGLVVSDPAIMMGKPVIAGARITVELILEKLAAGETAEQILDAHPRLTREAIYAALAFAVDSLPLRAVPRGTPARWFEEFSFGCRRLSGHVP